MAVHERDLAEIKRLDDEVVAWVTRLDLLRSAEMPGDLGAAFGLPPEPVRETVRAALAALGVELESA